MAVILICSNVFVNVFTFFWAIVDFKYHIIDENAHQVHFVTCQTFFQVGNQCRSNLLQQIKVKRMFSLNSVLVGFALAVLIIYVLQLCHRI